MVKNDNRLLLDSDVVPLSEDSQTIAEFLKKPISIHSGSFTSTDAINTDIHTFTITSQLYGRTLWDNKLRGYAMVRGTAVVRLVLNPQPFQAGRLLLRYIPNPVRNGVALSRINRNRSITQKTQHPNVELDVTQTSCELRIPYTAPTMWHARSIDSTIDYDWAAVYITSLSPVRSGSVNTIPYTIYLYFEDFELAGPLGIESGVDTKVTKKRTVERRNYARNGVVSGTLEALREPTQALSKIPVLSPFVGMADAVLDFGSGVAAAFGWSKPQDVGTTSNLTVKPFYRKGNYNGNTTSDVLAIDAANTLSSMSGFTGTGEDEMSFAYLKRIPALTDVFTWNTTAPVGSQLYAKELSPLLFKRNETIVVNTQSTTVAYGPPICYLARLFSQWRGSIEITLKFVKTTFHSGRIEVVFAACGSLANSVNATNAPYAYREIVDIRDSNEITLRIPYIYPSMYASTDSYAGLLGINVVNPLVASSTVSSVIDVLVYYNGGPDFELAVPRMPNTTMVIEMDEPSKLGDFMIGGAQDPVETLAPAHSCVGELFTSVKQLTNRQVPMYTAFSPAANNPIAGWTTFRWNPFVHGYLRFDPASTGPGQFLVPAVNRDLLAELAAGYFYERGGVIISNPGSGDGQSTYVFTVPNTSVVGRTFVTTNPAPRNILNTPSVGGSYTHSSDSYQPSAGGQVFRNSFIAGQVDATVPHYSTLPLRCVTYLNASADLVPSYRDIPNSDIVVTVQSSRVERMFMRGGADDYTLHFFAGFPGFIPVFGP